MKMDLETILRIYGVLQSHGVPPDNFTLYDVENNQHEWDICFSGTSLTEREIDKVMEEVIDVMEECYE